MMTFFRMPTGLPTVRAHEHAINLRVTVAPIWFEDMSMPSISEQVLLLYVFSITFTLGYKITYSARDVGSQSRETNISQYIFKSNLISEEERWRLAFLFGFRSLNKETISDKFSILVIWELVDEFAQFTTFLKIDLKSGYHQIHMKPRDAAKTAIRTHKGPMNFW